MKDDTSKWNTSIEDLITRAKVLYSSIYVMDCFSSHDVREYESVVAELEARGYEVVEVKSIDIIKTDD